MFTLNDDLSIYATRGDTVFFAVSAENNGVAYMFQPGDVLRIKVFEKKNCENVVLQKDFPVKEERESVDIFLSEQDTKIGEVISKPRDYWYEIELNPYTEPQTIIGYSEDGPAIFKLYPEGKDIPEVEVKPEDVPVIDEELDMTSNRPVENRAIARAVVKLTADFDTTKKELNTKDNALSARMNDIAETVQYESARLDLVLSSTTTDDAEVIDIRVGTDGSTYGSAGTAVRSQFKKVDEDLAELRNLCVNQSLNLYNPSLQTNETISPHYYVNGFPYSTTQFDGSYNCTFPIKVEQNKTYTVGLVPAVNGYTAPWATAVQGVFFYDENDRFISGTNETTFITPVGTKTMRFNYSIVEGITLVALNLNCMLVKGDSLPEEFVPYRKETIQDQITAVKMSSLPGTIQYLVDGDTLKVASNYSAEKDLLVTLKKKGGNNLFEFASFATFTHGKPIENLSESDLLLLQNIETDWHSPFVVAAKTNIDGDMPDSLHFTGGNHDYTNTGSGGTPTARTSELRFFADNIEITDGYGKCYHLEIHWTNYVQAYNTKKIDGSGREVLKENHILSFNGYEWVSHVEILPLEDISVNRWYGLQITGTKQIYPNIRYIGGANRGLYNGLSPSSCGDNKATKVVCFGDKHKAEVEIDPNYDIGSRCFYPGTSGIFAEPYGKAYFYIIDYATLYKDCVYAMRGKFKFTSM